jgi:hypothetical protein
MVCPPATSEAGARPLEGQLSLQINVWSRRGQFHLIKALVAAIGLWGIWRQLTIALRPPSITKFLVIFFVKCKESHVLFPNRFFFEKDLLPQLKALLNEIAPDHSFIWSDSWPYIQPQRSQEDIPYHFTIGKPCHFKTGKVCPFATSKAGARPLEGQTAVTSNKWMIGGQFHLTKPLAIAATRSRWLGPKSADDSGPVIRRTS